MFSSSFRGFRRLRQSAEFFPDFRRGGTCFVFLFRMRYNTGFPGKFKSASGLPAESPGKEPDSGFPGAEFFLWPISFFRAAGGGWRIIAG